MIGLNHAVTGALVAVAIKEPLVAFPAALLSHFVIDAIPHWNYKLPGKPAHQRTVMLADLAASIVFTVILAWIAVDMAWLVIACALLAMLPDAMFLPYLLHGRPSLKDKKSLLYPLRRFHLAIQRSETGPGISIELLWLAIMLQLFLRFAD